MVATGVADRARARIKHIHFHRRLRAERTASRSLPARTPRRAERMIASAKTRATAEASVQPDCPRQRRGGPSPVRATAPAAADQDLETRLSLSAEPSAAAQLHLLQPLTAGRRVRQFLERGGTRRLAHIRDRREQQPPHHDARMRTAFLPGNASDVRRQRSAFSSPRASASRQRAGATGCSGGIFAKGSNIDDGKVAAFARAGGRRDP